MRTLLLIAILSSSGCAYRVGGGLVAGALDEVGGDGRTQGLEGATNDLVERALLVELGHQLGAGLSSGATEITAEQRQELERTIDSLLSVAGKRAGRGLRDEVGPELRQMVRRDIVDAFADGVRGELGPSLEETVDRVIARSVVSLRENLSDDATRYMISDVLRDAVYYAMREGQGTPSVSETLETTLTNNMLGPIEQSVGNISEIVARQVDETTRQSQNTLRSIIGVLVLVGGVFGMLYLIRNRQVRRLQEANLEAARGLRSVDAALELLDEHTRAEILGKVQEYNQMDKRETVLVPPDPASRSDDYLR